MYPNLFGVSFLHTYGLCIGIGIILCLFILDVYVKKKKIDNKFYTYFYFLVIATIVLGFLSAALAQAIYNYIENPSAGFHFGDMTFLGGLLGGIIVFFILFFFTKGYKRGKISAFLPIIPCSITIAHAFGRIGCFMAGCCYGVETNAWFGIKFPGMASKVIPIQLFEAVFLFILFATLYFMQYKKTEKYTFPVYLMSYGIWRFFIEFLRGDDRGSFIGSLSPSQFWSIIMVIAGIIYAIVVFKKKKTDL